MTDPIVPGGAGLPEQQISPPGAQPEDQPESPPEASPEVSPEVPPEAVSPWLPAEAMPASTPAPGDDGAGYGMPAGGGFGAPLGTGFGSPPAGSPSTGFTPGPALTPMSARRVGRRQLIIIGILVAVVAIVVYAVKDNTAPSDLKVGNCFDVPTTASPEDTVSSVQHHPCTDSHTGEVIFVGDYTGSTTYPAVSDFDTFVGSTCKPAFLTYVGKDLDAAPDFSIGYFYPLANGWTNGDHGVTCYVTRTDNGPMTSSVKGSGAPAASATP